MVNAATWNIDAGRHGRDVQGVTTAEHVWVTKLMRRKKRGSDEHESDVAVCGQEREA